MNGNTDFDTALRSPELLRRALDHKRGADKYRCRTDEHEKLVEQLSSLLSEAELRARLIALHARIDPPAFARVCTCEESSDG